MQRQRDDGQRIETPFLRVKREHKVQRETVRVRITAWASKGGEVTAGDCRWVRPEAERKASEAQGVVDAKAKRHRSSRRELGLPRQGTRVWPGDRWDGLCGTRGGCSPAVWRLTMRHHLWALEKVSENTEEDVVTERGKAAGGLKG